MKKAYKTKSGNYYVISGDIIIKIYSYGQIACINKSDDLVNITMLFQECDLSEAVAAFDKVVKSLKDKMI